MLQPLLSLVHFPSCVDPGAHAGAMEIFLAHGWKICLHENIDFFVSYVFGNIKMKKTTIKKIATSFVNRYMFFDERYEDCWFYIEVETKPSESFLNKTYEVNIYLKSEDRSIKWLLLNTKDTKHDEKFYLNAITNNLDTYVNDYMEVCSSEYRSRRHNKKKTQIIKIETGEMLYYMCGDYVYQVELFNNGHGDVCCIVAGRQVLIDDYKDDFDGIVMCCLPGSEGQGVASVLYGNSNFIGKLPSPWYSSLDQIGTGESWLEIGYGLQY